MRAGEKYWPKKINHFVCVNMSSNPNLQLTAVKSNIWKRFHNRRYYHVSAATIQCSITPECFSPKPLCLWIITFANKYIQTDRCAEHHWLMYGLTICNLKPLFSTLYLLSAYFWKSRWNKTKMFAILFH